MQTLGLEVIAEDEETEPARALLTRYGIRAYQGYPPCTGDIVLIIRPKIPTGEQWKGRMPLI